MVGNKKKFAIILIPLVVIFSIFIFSCKNDVNEVSFEEAVIDLSKWDFHREGPARMDGKWDFYFSQLLEPNDFAAPGLQKATMQDVPNSWENYYIEDGGRAPAEGFATYKVRLILPKDSGMMALKVGSISTAYQLWVEGNLLSSSGVVSETKKDSFSKSVPDVVFFEPDAQEVDIVIQVSSYSYHRSGITKSIQIGNASDIIKMEHIRNFLIVFFATIMLAVSLYYGIFYLLRPKDKPPLFLSLVSLVLFLSTLLTTDGLGSYIFPMLSLSFEEKIRIALLMAALPLLMLFFHYLFGRKTSRKIIKATRYVTLFSMVLILSLPLSRYNPIWPLFLIFIFFNLSYLCYFLLRQIKNKKENAILLFVGIALLSLSILCDIFFDLIGFESGKTLYIGISFFLLCSTLALLRKTVKSIRDAEILSRDLEELNMQMAEGYNLIEKIVEERTNQLKNAKENLELVNIELQKDKNLLRRIAVTDGLTKLYNHRFLINGLIKEINRADRYTRKLSIIMMDIDYFKKINDTHGHLFGDVALKKVGDIIKANIRKVDIAGRYGGEEFLIILPETNIVPAMHLAERIRIEVESYQWNLLSDKKERITITISGGVAELDEENYLTLLKKADNMLYKAKDNGRNRIEGY